MNKLPRKKKKHIKNNRIILIDLAKVHEKLGVKWKLKEILNMHPKLLDQLEPTFIKIQKLKHKINRIYDKKS